MFTFNDKSKFSVLPTHLVSCERHAVLHPVASFYLRILEVSLSSIKLQCVFTNLNIYKRSTVLGTAAVVAFILGSIAVTTYVSYTTPIMPIAVYYAFTTQLLVRVAKNRK